MNDLAEPPAQPGDGGEHAGGDAGADIDHAGAIARLMGDGALLARVLARFRNEYRPAAARIRAALDGGDVPLALRLAHTLKGAAGLIEAVPLRRAAQALEQVLRADGADPYPHLARLERALERVLRELDAVPATVLETQDAARQAAVRMAAPARQFDDRDVLARLAGLLDDGNGDAVDLVCDAAAALTAQLGEHGYRELASLIDAFDFDGALALLKRHGAAG
ncbi:Hpt domain-containing protein [Massilia forsythiae]|uniref:Hpt domain-containing protein n=1 Tax=Massilia forsythiae TaxID=2728020 RepID=A0A7Z2ZTQ3_9BURK|nr:Hpt domain-containing protein [Massilia forsythiae]QJE00237.1 Hpt domain-containing protein [Massilia forsythiae]